MKVSICDICIQDNKVGYGSYKQRIRDNTFNSIVPTTLSLDLCENHKTYFKGCTPREAMEKYNKLWKNVKPLWRIDILFEKNLK